MPIQQYNGGQSCNNRLEESSSNSKMANGRIERAANLNYDERYTFVASHRTDKDDSMLTCSTNQPIKRDVGNEQEE